MAKIIKCNIPAIERSKREQEELLIEGCKVMAEDMIKITKEWETTDATLNVEW
jgi:hypothetical protein